MDGFRKPFVIAFDFDETLTALPEIWSAFVKVLKSQGIQPVCVTCRRNTSENAQQVNEFLDAHGMQMPVFLTGLASKLWHMENLGIKVAIWVDDDPKTINGH